MSFILDALRKSDQQRQRATTPVTLATREPLPEARATAFPVNGVIAAVLLVLGILVGWLRPWQHDTPMPVAVTRPVAEMPRPVAPPPAAPTPLVPAAQVKLPPVAPARVAKAPPKPPAVIQPEATIRPVPTTPEPSAVVDQDAKAMAIADLPPEIRQEVPNLSISLHAYAGKPRDRMVMINDKLLHQGDAIASGLVLEQITPDGVILGFKGFHIRRGVR